MTPSTASPLFAITDEAGEIGEEQKADERRQASEANTKTWTRVMTRTVKKTKTKTKASENIKEQLERIERRELLKDLGLTEEDVYTL
ncbi:hypothetical protein Sps_04198 [Shewanella psychrophila]|uniref:Uncharacterized protein n=1 Tax=Shewanella psychrophila TaxID=225848 RepID=A0A1S6HV36_9GAMM|nr:hypothetical protein [Shewanella psychrophila]AQS39304.1 hypothetical protein Sps_04198 [Shewanella psychrophila]